MISVIIPAYKARKFLPDCLASIGAQTLQPCEVLVIDDASPEPVDDIVADFAGRPGYPPIHLIRHEVNRGQAAGRNTGMKAAQGDWFAFIDCDDIWANDHLENLSESMEMHGTDLVFCRAKLFHDAPNNLLAYEEGPMSPQEHELDPLALLRRCFIITSSVAVRAAAARDVGGFDESSMIRGVEDLDFFMSLLRSGARVRMAARSTLFYRKHPDSETGKVGNLSRQDILVKERHIGWVVGSWHKKREVLIESYWYAAHGLWLARTPDRIHWLLRSVFVSMPRPILGLRWFIRFLKMIRHGIRLRGQFPIGQ